MCITKQNVIDGCLYAQDPPPTCPPFISIKYLFPRAIKTEEARLNPHRHYLRAAEPCLGIGKAYREIDLGQNTLANSISQLKWSTCERSFGLEWVNRGDSIALNDLCVKAGDYRRSGSLGAVWRGIALQNESNSGHCVSQKHLLFSLLFWLHGTSGNQMGQTDEYWQHFVLIH